MVLLSIELRQSNKFRMLISKRFDLREVLKVNLYHNNQFHDDGVILSFRFFKVLSKYLVTSVDNDWTIISFGGSTIERNKILICLSNKFFPGSKIKKDSKVNITITPSIVDKHFDKSHNLC
jgi:hypothetical protein